MKSEVWHEDALAKEPDLKIEKKYTRCQLVWQMPVPKNDDPELSKPYWLQAAVFGPLAEECKVKLHKGDNVKIKGRLNANRWRGSEDQLSKASLHIIAFRVWLCPSMGAEPIEIIAPKTEKPALKQNIPGQAKEKAGVVAGSTLSDPMQLELENIRRKAIADAKAASEAEVVDHSVNEFLTGQAAPVGPGEAPDDGEIPF